MLTFCREGGFSALVIAMPAMNYSYLVGLKQFIGINVKYTCYKKKCPITEAQDVCLP